MNNNENTSLSLGAATQSTKGKRRHKRPYAPPKLSALGNVVDLTRGGGSPSVDFPFGTQKGAPG